MIDNKHRGIMKLYTYDLNCGNVMSIIGKLIHHLALLSLWNFFTNEGFLQRERSCIGASIWFFLSKIS